LETYPTESGLHFSSFGKCVSIARLIPFQSLSVFIAQKPAAGLFRRAFDDDRQEHKICIVVVVFLASRKFERESAQHTFSLYPTCRIAEELTVTTNAGLRWSGPELST
jgi:hypothetical protein